MRGLETEITEEAQKLIRRFENYARGLADEHQRRSRRTTLSIPPLSLRRPLYWSLARGFDPYEVRAAADCIAHAITAKVSQKTYTPYVPFRHFVAKAGGGLREVCVFQVADSAVSRIIYDQLRCV